MYNGRRSLPSATFCLPGPPPRPTLFIPRPAAIRSNPLSTRQAPRSLIRASFRGRGRPPPTPYRVARSIFQYRAGLIPRPSKGRVFAGAGILRRPSSYVRSPIPRSVFFSIPPHTPTLQSVNHGPGPLSLIGPKHRLYPSIISLPESSPDLEFFIPRPKPRTLHLVNQGRGFVNSREAQFLR